MYDSLNVFASWSTMTYFPSVHPQCSKTCGRGLRKRSVFCSSNDPGAKAVVVPDSMCRQHHRPKAQETCVLRRCPKNERLQWIPTPWGEVGEKSHETRGAEPTGFKQLFSHLEEQSILEAYRAWISLKTAFGDVPCICGYILLLGGVRAKLHPFQHI